MHDSSHTTSRTASKCSRLLLLVWILFMAKLLSNTFDLEYLANGSHGDIYSYAFECAYFMFYSVIAWHAFVCNNILQIYDQPSCVWSRLEEQFVRLNAATTTASSLQESMDASQAHLNVYTTNSSSPASALMHAVEIDASADNFTYSYSDLYALSHAFSKPVILRNFVPITFDTDTHLLLHLLDAYGNQSVPAMQNEKQASIRFQHGKVSHDYAQFDGITLDSLFLNQRVADHTSYDMVKFWHVCDKNNNSDFWTYFNMDRLQIPASDLAAAGMFMSNLPKSDAGSTSRGKKRWYLSADFHSDVGPSFFVQLQGSKLWRLVDLKYTHLMRPIWYGTYGRSYGYNAEHFNLIPRYEMVLKAGDVIFFPPWIWHEASIDHNAGFEVSCGIKLFREANMLASVKKSAIFTVNTLTSVARAALFGNGRSKLC